MSKRPMRPGWDEAWGHCVERPSSVWSLGDHPLDPGKQHTPLATFWAQVQQFDHGKAHTKLGIKNHTNSKPYWFGDIQCEIAGLNEESERDIQIAVEDAILRAADLIRAQRDET